MADLQISNLPALAEAGIQATDVLALADLSASETKKVTVKDLVAAAVALLDSGDIPAVKVATPFAANAVATATIQDLAVTAGKIANGTITATQIANATITATQLVNDTITATQIAANAITASELADDAVDTAAIADLAVDNARIANTTIAYAKLNLSDGDIPGAKLTSASVTATQLATNSVTATELADNAVDTAAVANAAITGAKIASNTIAAGNIVNNTITGTQIANAAIDTAQLADGAVTTAKLSGTISAGTITDGAVGTAKLADDAVDSSKLAANAVDAAALADNAVDSGAIASNAVIEAKIAANAVTNAKITDGTITAAKLNTSNIDRSLNVASGNLGINNTVTAATRSGITYNAQGLITGTVALAAADLPVATSSAVGGVSVGTGLSVNGSGVLALSNSVTGATVSGITFNNQGQITAATALTSANLPIATTSAKGAVQITSGGGLSVDSSGNLTTSVSGISAGTYQSVTVNTKGVLTAGAALTASLIPDLAASKITSGTLDAARIGVDTIDGTKLSNSSTTIIQSIAQLGYPTALFTGQLLFDPIAEDAYLWDGNAWNPITTLTKGALVRLGTYNANLSQVDYVTAAGSAAGLTVGQNLPVASESVDGGYVVISVQGTPSGIAGITGQLQPPDYLLGVTASSTSSSWVEIDLSTTVASQQASAISYTPHGQLSSTNVQLAINELEDEKIAKAGGTVTGELLIGNAGSFVFEGSTVDAFETRLTVADPTTSDKTITLPNVTGTVITSGDTNTVTSTMVDASLVNANLAAGAAIAFSKLAALTSAQILVGNGSNEVTAVAVTGDISINNAGLTAIASNVIVDADIKSDAAISGSKIVQGTTSVLGVLQLTDSTSSTSTTTAATPNAVKTAYDLANTANTNATNAAQTTGTTFTGNVIIDNAKELRLSEADSDGAHFTGFKAQAQSADITYTLPATAPTTGQVLKSGSTATTLEWGSDTATDGTKMPLAGGTFTGDVTFTGDSSNGLWDKSASAFVANLTGNVTGNVTGNASGSAATVTGAAQTAITSLGTLTGLTVSGDVTIADKIVHSGDTDTALRFPAVDTFTIETGGAERARFNSAGRVLIGTTASEDFAYTGKLQVVGSSPTDAAISVKISSNDALGSALVLAKSRGSLIVNDDDQIGAIAFCAHDGTDTVSRGAEIIAQVDGTPGANSMPGRLVFKTNGSEQLRIDSAGKIAQGTITPRERVHFHYDSSDENYLRFTNSTTGNASGDGLNIGLNSSEQALIWLKENNSMLFGTNNTTALTINSSQNATFAGTVTATSFSGSGANLTNLPASGGSITATASGAIAANKSCVVNANGTVSQIASSVVPSVLTSRDTESGSDDFTIRDSVWLTSTFFIVIGIDSNGNTKSYNNTVDSAGSITLGSMGIFTGNNDGDGLCIAVDESTSKIFSIQSTGNDFFMQGGVINSNGDGVDMGAADWGSDGSNYTNQYAMAITSDDNGEFSAAYRASNNVRFRCFTLNASNTLSKSAEETLSGTYMPTNSEKNITIEYIPSVEMYLVISSNASNCRAIWVKSNGTSSAPTVTGYSTALTGSAIGTFPQLSYDSVSGKAVLSYRNTSGKPAARVLSFSGSAASPAVPTVGSEVILKDETCDFIRHVWNKTKKMAVFYICGDDNHVKCYTISGTSLADASHNLDIFSSVDYANLSICTNPSLNRVIVATKNEGSSNHLSVSCLDIPETTTNLTAENFVGFSSAGYSDTATATINVVGNTTTQSSLTPGQKYYVKIDGTLSTTADSPSVDAGLALSSTSLLIK